MAKNQSLGNKLNRTSSIAYFAIVVLFVTIKMLSHYGVLSFLGETGGIVLSVVIQIGLMFLISVGVMWAVTKKKPLEVFRFYGFKKISWKGVAIAFVMGIIVYILTVYASTFFHIILQMLGFKSPESEPMQSYPIWQLLLNILLTAILPAICEETCHRGMVLNGTSSAKKRSTAIILTSILFGLLHCNIEQWFYTTLIGFFLGYLASVMENIYPAIIIHFTNNALSVFMGYSQFHNLGATFVFDYVSEFMSNNAIMGILFLIILLAFLGLLLKFLTALLFKHTILKQIHSLNNKVLKQMEKDDYLQDLSSIVKSGETCKPPTEMQDFSKFKTLFYEYGKDYGFTSELKREVGEDLPAKKDWVSTAFNVASIVILSAVTIMSFIWGII
ncbi:MAG: CPBP family intramembrane metalloprotease [Clostridiales bacterium]|nr:CPBP family intramembrane metalloprotease [Clostridiales bacterium]